MRSVGLFVLALVAAGALAFGATGSVKSTIGVKSNDALGSIVVSSTGRTLYHITSDHGKAVTCVASCATLWPPLTIAKTAKPVAGTGLTASKLGTIKRPDGTVQVTYSGYALYRYSGDAKTGDVNGQAFQSKWFAVAPTGKLIKTVPAPASTSSSTSSSSSSSSSDTSDPGYGY
jgi:predicted lipoprotein with Yx(FWY)xxD motif